MTASLLTIVETETTRCAVCAEDSPRRLGEIWLGEQLLGRVVQCTACGLRFMSPRPTQRQRDWLYEREYGSDLPGRHEDTRFESVQGDQDRGLTRFGRYLDRLEVRRQTSRNGSSPRLLDVGAGTGQLLELARDRGWDVHAVEQSEDARHHLAGLFGGRAVVGRTLADCRESEERYDGIVMAHVIEHLPDPLASLRVARRLLAPDGRLLVATPNEVSLYERLWLARQRWRRRGAANEYVAIEWDENEWRRRPARTDAQALVEFQILTTEHLYFFTRATLHRLLVRAGFRGVSWSAGSVAPANSRLGRAVRNDAVNRVASFVRLQSELVALAGAEAVAA